MPPRADDAPPIAHVAAPAAHDVRRSLAQVEAAEQIARRLATYAAAVVDDDGTVTVCGVPGCPLDEHTAGRTAGILAVGLVTAAIEPAPRARPDGDPRQLHLAHRRFVDLLGEAAASVYVCRRTAHRSGRCFFDAQGPDSALCGRVLAVSRRYELGVLAG